MIPKDLKILYHRGDWSANASRKSIDGYGGIGYYRVVKPAEIISKKFNVEVIGRKFTEMGKNPEEQWTKIWKESDVFHTIYFHNASGIAWCCGSRDFFNKTDNRKRVILDMDDDYLHIDPDNPEADKYGHGKSRRANIGAFVSLVDAITVSTEPLKEVIEKRLKDVHGISKPIFVIPNCNDENDFKFERVERDPKYITIGYMGSQSHYGDFKFFLPIIKRILEKFPQVRFQMIGVVSGKELIKLTKGWSDDLRLRFDIVYATPSFRDFPKHLANQPWDIGIAPLLDTQFNRAKSHIKWMEYAMYEIPTVASRVYPYFMEIDGKDTIKDGITGVLCRPHEWDEKLERIILDKTYRETIGRNAKEYVLKAWQYKDSGILDTYQKMLDTIYP